MSKAAGDTPDCRALVDNLFVARPVEELDDEEATYSP